MLSNNSCDYYFTIKRRWSSNKE